MHSPTTKLSVVIINTGGTINKRYQPITGELAVAPDEKTLCHLLTSASPNLDLHIIGLIHKDSLDLTSSDRQSIVDAIMQLPISRKSDPIIIVHGTDTMDETARFLDEQHLNRTIILTGSMQPAQIDSVEAAIHLGLTLGFISARPSHGVFIAMHGRVLPHNQFVKNRKLGIFLPSQ